MWIIIIFFFLDRKDVCMVVKRLTRVRIFVFSDERGRRRVDAIVLTRERDDDERIYFAVLPRVARINLSAVTNCTD